MKVDYQSDVGKKIKLAINLTPHQADIFDQMARLNGFSGKDRLDRYFLCLLLRYADLTPAQMEVLLRDARLTPADMKNIIAPRGLPQKFRESVVGSMRKHALRTDAARKVT
jgi:hypothetical protein